MAVLLPLYRQTGTVNMTNDFLFLRSFDAVRNSILNRNSCNEFFSLLHEMMPSNIGTLLRHQRFV